MSKISGNAGIRMQIQNLCLQANLERLLVNGIRYSLRPFLLPLYRSET